MLCQRCNKNEANVFYRESINGKEKTYALCSECAKELEKNGEIHTTVGSGIFDNHITTPSIDMSSLFGSLFGVHSSAGALEKSKRCSLCGGTFANFVKSGKAGCPNCYREFSEEISETVNRIHGNTVHSGRTPRKMKDKFDRAKELEKLKADLTAAISAEEFEKAAELRDRIREIEKNG